MSLFDSICCFGRRGNIATWSQGEELGRDAEQEFGTLSEIMIRVLGMYQWFILEGC